MNPILMGVSVLLLPLLQDERLEGNTVWSWRGWERFPVGSTATFEFKTQSRVEFRRTFRLKERTDESVLIEAVTEVDGRITGTSEDTYGRVRKRPQKEISPCCDHHPPVQRERTKERVSIGDQEFECDRSDFVVYNCDGGIRCRNRFWNHPEVPGGVVRIEVLDGMPYTSELVAFNRKGSDPR